MEAGSGAEVTITVNGEQRLAGAGSSLLNLVEALGFAGRPIAVEIDGDVVPRSRLGERAVGGGERIEIVTFVGGG
jgi:sulfur carrier protein